MTLSGPPTARASPHDSGSARGDVPLCFGGGFVDRVPERDRVRHFREGRREVEIGGGIEDRDYRPERRASVIVPAFIADTSEASELDARKRRILRLGSS
mgnify:CR=1 FL=1